MAVNVLPFQRPSVDGAAILDLHAPFAKGIEAEASIIEMRLALQFYWQHHSKDAWKVHLLPVGRA